MPKPLLSKAEVDALMGLFEPGDPGTERAAPRREKAAANGDAVNALKSACEDEARRWSEALEKLTGHPTNVTLRSIVRAAGGPAEGEVCFRLGSDGRRFLICSESLVNLVNEKSLGALEEPPALLHPLSAIDRALFEACGAFLGGEEGLVSLENPPEAAMRIEARYAVDIAPLLRTTVRLLIDEQDGQLL